jgi:hypothetical protein
MEDDMNVKHRGVGKGGLVAAGCAAVALGVSGCNSGMSLGMGSGAPRCSNADGQQVVIHLLQDNDLRIRKTEGDPKYELGKWKFSDVRPVERKDDIRYVSCVADLEVTVTKSPQINDPVAGATWGKPETETVPFRQFAYSLQFTEDGDIWAKISR